MSSEGDGQDLTSVAAAWAKAKQEGFDVRMPGPKEVFLDLDSDAELALYKKRRPFAERLLGCWEKERWRSKSGQGWHVVVQCACDITPAQRIAIQAALGSDWKREIIGVLRLLNGVEEPTTLFKPTEMQDVAF